MPAFLSGLAAKARAHKLVTLLVVLLLAGALGAGGYFGWRTWQYRQTSEYAVEQLKAALTPPKRKSSPSGWIFARCSRSFRAPWPGPFPFTRPARTRNMC